MYLCISFFPHPIQIHLQPGQRVNLTLYDFAAKSDDKEDKAAVASSQGLGKDYCATKYAQVRIKQEYIY